MALFVVFTIFLRQQGSSESKKCDEDSFDKRDLVPKKESPRSVKKGGFYLSFYKHSLTIILLLLFVFSFLMHWYGSWLDYNEQQYLERQPTEEFFKYLQIENSGLSHFKTGKASFYPYSLLYFYPFICANIVHHNPNR